ncbi:MAG: hypothetical protein ABI175_29800, partial [Polyangiales bacterium]
RSDTGIDRLDDRDHGRIHRNHDDGRVRHRGIDRRRIGRARLGGRFLVDILLHGLGVAASLDYFPGGEDRTEILQLTLLGQASF